MKFDVAVIGADAAGLAAARALSGAGKRVCIIEARSRAGGRISTLHISDLPLPIQLGAEGSGAHDALARPMQKTLFFAGEATSGDETGTVAGGDRHGTPCGTRISAKFALTAKKFILRLAFMA